MKKLLFGILVTFALVAIAAVHKNSLVKNPTATKDSKISDAINNPLSLDVMRSKSYPGSDITIEEDLGAKGNYKEYIASYRSEGLKIYALLTVPAGAKPESGWPVIVFNHGYIPPAQYKTNERYVDYVDSFARNGYIVFKPDYRGNGKSEGDPEGAYYSPAYTTDVLNALASIKKYPNANSNKIGMWGHSLGGNITLRSIEVASGDIKAAVIWSGVVGSYDDLMNRWRRRVSFQPSERELALRNRTRTDLINKYGTPQTNPTFWQAIDPTYHLDLISTPVQLHHGLADETVPEEFSQSLYDKMKSAGKVVELYTYEGANHNISSSFSQAMQRSVEFFGKYLKGS